VVTAEVDVVLLILNCRRRDAASWLGSVGAAPLRSRFASMANCMQWRSRILVAWGKRDRVANGHRFVVAADEDIPDE